ncbi:hypothetical protein HOY82DRAFT_649152 [Tuber indicum]|nr:hypothetical protein HOY82DRAFT_649152 [Tuber indicum]
MPAHPTPTPEATLTVSANFTCTDYKNTFLAFRCPPNHVAGHTSVPCIPGREYGIFNDNICREEKIVETVSLVLALVFSLFAFGFILSGAYIVKKRIKPEVLLVWRVTVNEDEDEDGNELRNNAPHKALDLRKAVPPSYHSYLRREDPTSAPISNIGGYPPKAFHKSDDDKRCGGCGCTMRA